MEFVSNQTGANEKKKNVAQAFIYFSFDWDITFIFIAVDLAITWL